MWSGLPFCSHRYRLRHNKFAESFFCGKGKVPIFSTEDLDNYRPQLDECPSTHVLCISWQYCFILYIKEKINGYHLLKKFILFYSWSKICWKQDRDDRNVQRRQYLLFHEECYHTIKALQYSLNILITRWNFEFHI